MADGVEEERGRIGEYLDEKADYWKDEARTALDGGQHKRHIAYMAKYEALVQAKLDILDAPRPGGEKE